jgi:hypothetical protein
MYIVTYSQSAVPSLWILSNKGWFQAFWHHIWLYTYKVDNRNDHQSWPIQSPFTYSYKGSMWKLAHFFASHFDCACKYNITKNTNSILPSLFTYSNEHSPSWEATQFSASQEIHILWNPKVHYHICKCLKPVPIPRQINQPMPPILHPEYPS